jgi:hypothetical protein
MVPDVVRLPESLLVANPLDRYLINSPMLPQLDKDTDGGLTLLIQHDSPARIGKRTGYRRRRARS